MTCNHSCCFLQRAGDGTVNCDPIHAAKYALRPAYLSDSFSDSLPTCLHLGQYKLPWPTNSTSHSSSLLSSSSSSGVAFLADFFFFFLLLLLLPVLRFNGRSKIRRTSSSSIFLSVRSSSRFGLGGPAKTVRPFFVIASILVSNCRLTLEEATHQQ